METTNKLKPDWAGSDILSQIVNILIKTKPIYAIMKQQARKVLIETAEKNGVLWRKIAQDLEQPAQQYFTEFNNPNITYPDYYQVPFHAYNEGNLCWQAALETIPATYAMALRVWKNEPLTWENAHQRLRSSFHQVLENYLPTIVNDVLDVGCSVGISTLFLHRYLTQRQTLPVKTIGIDLSPYMLSVAKVNDSQQEISQWVQGLAEKTDFPDQSFDLITIQFVTHELPHQASKDIFKECFRLLRKNGCLAIVDNNPTSPVIQNLPPILFTLMKSTEPWSDEYYTFDMESALKDIGFDYQTTVASDPRHRTLIALKPL